MSFGSSSLVEIRDDGSCSGWAVMGCVVGLQDCAARVPAQSFIIYGISQIIHSSPERSRSPISLSALSLIPSLSTGR